MSTITEIEAAIENLPAPEVDELSRWLEAWRAKRPAAAAAESWLESARGAALPGVTTASMTALTRGEKR